MLRLPSCVWRGALVLMLASAGAHAEEALHRDIHEAIITLPFAARDLDGKETRGDIVITHFRPDGAGPFPLVIISHGRDQKTRAEMSRVRFESAARYFVRKGFAVAVPTRLGYSDTASLGDPETSGRNCALARYDAALEAASSEIEASVRRMQQEPWIDAKRTVLVGQSVGGISTVAATSRGIPGLRVAINFAGGHGGDPDKHPGIPCNPTALENAFSKLGRAARAPMLWVYAENDQYFNPEHSRAWHAAYTQAGGNADYRLMPAFKDNGHNLFSRGNTLWQPIVDAWLQRFGFMTPGFIPPPPASGYARIDDLSRVPSHDAKTKESSYVAFLSKPLPRAYALSTKGNWGWATGEDDLLSRALAFCQRKSGTPCRLYAVDNDVVWQPESLQ